jgi:hypothetical protein
MAVVAGEGRTTRRSLYRKEAGPPRHIPGIGVHTISCKAVQVSDADMRLRIVAWYDTPRVRESKKRRGNSCAQKGYEDEGDRRYWYI